MRKACHRAWIGGQATPGIIINTALRITPGHRSFIGIYLLPALLRQVARRVLHPLRWFSCINVSKNTELLLPCGGVIASNQTPHLCGGYLGSAAGFEPATCARKCEVFQPLCFYFASLHHSTFELHTSWCYLSFTFSTFHVLCMVAIRSIYPLYSSICSGL